MQILKIFCTKLTKKILDKNSWKNDSLKYQTCCDSVEVIQGDLTFRNLYIVKQIVLIIKGGKIENRDRNMITLVLFKFQSVNEP